MRSYKKGFTLVELIVAMAIIMVICSLGLKGIQLAKRTMNSLRANEAISDLTNFFSFSKLYCNKNNSAVIIYCKKDGTIEFKDINNNFNKKTTLPKGISFITNYSINCSNKGVLSPGSIYISDSKGEIYKLTISVGFDTINIYEGSSYD